ncbi:substrate-binding domain-containing protein [Conexibacter stalactiti]|uniref:Substrate-binding domain-containing protein n=1 Tax=Conexibacter stalactiti TaxID=1940611 RepID=A0ABU4HR88_9ACTN|nr:substrate-binding domain-containing protein [Conexibacter stalactiti]MDW5595797.1 substrate-binding domain-containing protein [Conexibacter stalactiti]MEC5036439.1 substrate-binding domain-containing protein [Conexibacter stalactiti]
MARAVGETPRRAMWLAALALAAPLPLAACGSSDGDSAGATAAGGTTSAASATTTADGAGAGSEQAAQAVEQLRVAPRPLEIPALERRPASGTSAYLISCTFVECQTLERGFAPAIEALGWQLRTVTSELTPEGIAAAWTQAVAARPAVIFALDVVPVSVIQSQLEEAERNGIAVVVTAGTTRVGEGGVDASIGGTRSHAADTIAAVDWAIADSGGKADIAFVYGPSVPMQATVFEAAKQEAARLCPDCSVEGITVKPTEVGKAIPGQVVSYVQKHPEVRYVLSDGSTIVLGVGQALKAAGLDVKVVTTLSQAQNFESVRNGVEAAAIPSEDVSLAWRMVDAGVRLVEGAELPEELADPVGQRQLFDAANVAEAPRQWEIPDVAATFTEAWQVG